MNDYVKERHLQAQPVIHTLEAIPHLTLAEALAAIDTVRKMRLGAKQS